MGSINNLIKNTKEFFDAVAIICRKIIKEEVNYNYTVTGKIKTDNGDGTYVVTINDSDSTLKPLNGMTYVVGDVVLVLVVNKNYSRKYILAKEP